MEKKKNLLVYYKNDGRLNGVKLTLDKAIINTLNLTKEDNKIIFKYKNKQIQIEKGTVEKEIEIKEENTFSEILKNSIINFEESKGYYTPKLNIPLGIANEWGINKDNKAVFLKLDNNTFYIYCEEDNMKHQETVSTKTSGSKILKRNGKIITIKVGKGGIGKSFITTQLATGLANYGIDTENGIKVLVITSDPQNDILGMSFKENEIPEYGGGLKKWVLKGEGDRVKLRKNCDFIPLEEASFGTSFVKKLPIFLDKIKEEYDYILIDSMPMMAIDKEFHKYSDKVILPMNGDKFTKKGIIKVMEEIGVEKVLAIVFNKFDQMAGQKKYYDEIAEIIKNTNTFLPKPIKFLSAIYKMTESGKTIWEMKSKNLEETKEVFTSLIEKILINTYEEPTIIEKGE